MKLLVTGARGFVAPFVARAVRAALGDQATLVGAALHEGEDSDIGRIVAMDLADPAAILETFRRESPTHVVHLGGVSSPVAAEADPEQAWNANLMGTLRCARALRATREDGVFVFAGSAQVYGVQAGDAPLTEASLLAPAGEYAGTKAAADVALGAIAHNGLRIIRFRSFNHTGPGQSEDFVVPRFAAQIARIEAGLQAPVIRVGNLEARRDFLDVRDVARAYAMGLMQGARLPAGAVFNLASGRAESIRWILEFLVSSARAPLQVETDPALWRAADAPMLLGDAGAAAAALGWRPEVSLEKTLTDVLDHCRARL